MLGRAGRRTVLAPEFGRGNGVNALQSARIDHIQINVIDLTAPKQF
jgi:hypothetical protein